MVSSTILKSEERNDGPNGQVVIMTDFPTHRTRTVRSKKVRSLIEHHLNPLLSTVMGTNLTFGNNGKNISMERVETRQGASLPVVVAVEVDGVIQLISRMWRLIRLPIWNWHRLRRNIRDY
jgi:hypothetical protein